MCSGTLFIEAKYQEIIVPAIWETETFTNKLGMEKEGQIWTFQDKGQRNVCLIPEVTQFGMEILGNTITQNEVVESKEILKNCLKEFDVEWNFKETVKRGLSYYVEDGFEVECPSLGAQKQVAGGGRYQEGVGWAIGVDRLMLA